MDKEGTSFTHLHRFLEHYKMKNGDIQSQFPAIIQFELSRGEYLEEEDVWIFFDSGRVVINKLNPYEYPMELDPKWQDYKFEDFKLVISGEHKYNNMIGKYKITITPV